MLHSESVFRNPHSSLYHRPVVCHLKSLLGSSLECRLAPGGSQPSHDARLLPPTVEHQTDIKPVNPEMAIFDVLHRQQVTKSRTSGHEDSGTVQIPQGPSEETQTTTNDVGTPTTVVLIAAVYSSKHRGRGHLI